MNDKSVTHIDDVYEVKKTLEFEIEKGLLKLNKAQYRLCLSFLKAKGLHHGIYPSEEHLESGIGFLNDLFTKTFISIDKRIILFRKMQNYMRQEYIKPFLYDWLLNDQPTCYFIWLYLKINLKNNGTLLPNSGILTALSNEPQNSHQERYQLVEEYFTTYFGKSVENYNKSEFQLIYKRDVLSILTHKWASYIKMSPFKWFSSGIPEVNQIVWKHMEENLPFLKMDYGVKRGKLSNKDKINYNLGRQSNKLDIMPMSFDEMEMASFCSFGIWVSCEDTRLEEINALKKKISRAISAKKLVAVKNIKIVKQYKG